MSAPSDLFHRRYLLALWAYLGVCGFEGRRLRMAVYGSKNQLGQLFETVRRAPLIPPAVMAVLDDNPDPQLLAWGLHPVHPETFVLDSVDAVFVACDPDTHEDAARRCRAFCGPSVFVLDPYDPRLMEPPLARD